MDDNKTEERLRKIEDSLEMLKRQIEELNKRTSSSIFIGPQSGLLSGERKALDGIAGKTADDLGREFKEIKTSYKGTRKTNRVKISYSIFYPLVSVFLSNCEKLL